MKVVIVCDGAIRANEVRGTIIDVLNAQKPGTIIFNPETDVYYRQLGFMECESVSLLIEPDIDNRIDRRLLASNLVCQLNFLNRQIFISSPM